MKRWVRAVVVVGPVLAVVAAGLAAMPGAGASVGSPIKGSKGLCADVSWSGGKSPVLLYKCDGSEGQSWTFEGAEGPVKAKGKCLGVEGESPGDGAAVTLLDCGDEGQTWWVTNGRLIHTASGKCLDARGGAVARTPLEIWPCAESDTQVWSVPEVAPEDGESAPPEPSTAAKKGVATWAYDHTAEALQDVGAGWVWDWSSKGEDVPEGVEFVPMMWGPGSVTDEELAAAKASGTSLLGFNEPDLPEQANMTVEEALELWPKLEETGLRLGSPAVAADAAADGGWLDKFMIGADEQKLGVDFITLHWFGSDFGDEASDHLLGYVNRVHERYGLPVWVTAFGLINFAGEPQYPTEEQLTTFITKATAGLEQADYVERYAYFGLPAVEESASYGLYGADGAPTAAGKAYKGESAPAEEEPVEEEPVEEEPVEGQTEPASVETRAAMVTTGVDALEDSMMKLVNDERTKAGCPTVAKNSALTKAARAHSKLMAEHNDQSHRLAGEQDLAPRIAAAGYANARVVAENVASGAFRTPEIAMYGGQEGNLTLIGFMQSDGHREAIQTCYADVGIGVFVDGKGAPWWTQDFATPF